MLRAIKYLIIDILFSYKYIYNIFSSQNRKERIKELRDRVGQMSLSKESTDEWIRNQAELKSLILRKNPFNFLRWKVIINTMFYGGNKTELQELMNSKKVDVYKEIMPEESCGNPRPFLPYPKSSGNRIHHIYNIEQLLRFDNFSLEQAKTIFEFGGGYGSMSNLFYRVGYQGSYTIFDFELFNALQAYYLTSTLGENITANFDQIGSGENQINLINKLDQIKLKEGVYDVFIAMWSLSESPLELRKEIWDRIGSPKSILIGYQKQFSNIDNRKYFGDLRKEKDHYEWSNWEIPHLPGHYYLVGLKR